MHIFEVLNRGSDVVSSLLRIWESSVKATHSFLTESEIEKIKDHVPQALREIPHLIVAENEDGVYVAFAGMDGQKLEMLFVSAENRARGIGKRLLRYAMDTYAVNVLTVNEQNPQAIGFYKHAGFTVYSRSETDEQGNLYPILYMKK